MSTVLRHPSLLDARRNHDAPIYALPLAKASRPLARAWLWLGLIALLGSGLFSVLLVLARTPGINALLPGADFFRTALVVHVDLSVLVWFVSIAGLLWSLERERHHLVDWAAYGSAAVGTAAIVVAPFLDPGTPVMANYVPVIDSGSFLFGLAAFSAGGIVFVLRVLSTVPALVSRLDGAMALRCGLYGAAVAMAVAAIALAWSLAEVPRSLDNRTYWEIVFWGPGHALQYAWTLLLLVAWLWLAQACGARIPLSARVTLLLFLVALAPVFITIYAYLAHDVVSVEHRALHTIGMRVGGGMAILPVALAVVIAMRRHRPSPSARPLRAALHASLLLFAAGGLIALGINGSNVKIPAHYHGCIVGVTLALMGLVYHLLPQLGYARPQGRLATMQPWLYGAGQLLHIVGLVWSGGYGVQRKIAGNEQILRTPAEVFGMGLMGLGGAVAIAGGLAFVIVVWRSLRRPAQA